MALFHRQNKLFKSNRQTNAVNIQQIYILNRKKPKYPLPKNSLEKKFRDLVNKKLEESQKKEVHNHIALKLENSRAKEIRDRLRILQPEQLKKEKIHTQITDSQITYNSIRKYSNAPDFSLDKEYLIVKKNLLKIYKKYKAN